MSGHCGFRKIEIGKTGVSSPPTAFKKVPPVPSAPGAKPAPAPAPAPAEEQSGDNSLLVFDKDDPIRFSIENGEVSLVLRAGEIPPMEFTRPEVAKVLIEAMKG